jgi:ATP-dependent DNA helicase RecG
MRYTWCRYFIQANWAIIGQKGQLLYIKEKGKITNSEYQLLNDCSRNTASNDLTDLLKKDLFISSNIRGEAAIYRLR